MNLKEIINEEQIFDVCLSLLAVGDEDGSDFSGPAGRVVTYRACQNLAKKKEEFTEEEIANEVNELIVGKVLERLAKRGDVEVNFDGKEITYSAAKGLKNDY